MEWGLRQEESCTFGPSVARLRAMQILRDLRASGHAITGFAAVGFGWAALSAQMPAIKAQIEASDATYGTLAFLGSVGAILAMFTAPLMHAWLGRVSMMVALFVMVIGFVMVGAAHGPALFLIGLFLAAGGSGVADVLANAEVSEREAETGRSLMNLNHGLFSVAYALAAVAVGWARGVGWSPLMVFLGLIVAVGVMIPWMRLSVQAAQDDKAQTGRLPRALVWLGGLVVLSAFLGEAASEGWSALHVERTLGGGPADGARGPALLALGMAVGRLGGHFFAGHLPPLRVMVVASCLAGFGLALAGVAPSIGLAYLGFAMGGLGVSVVGPLALGLVGQAVPGHLRLKAISQAAAMGYGAFFLGPVLMGFIAEIYGLRISFYVIAGIMFVVAAILLPLWAARLRALTN